MRQPDLSGIFRQITAIAIALGTIFLLAVLWMSFIDADAINIWAEYAGLAIVISGMALFLAQSRWPPFVTGHANWSDHFAETSGGEYCVVCKTPRLNHEHEWHGCRCRTCPEIREDGHAWAGCRCATCNSIGAVGHDPAACGVCRICHNPTVALRSVHHEFEDLPDGFDTSAFECSTAPKLWMHEGSHKKKCKQCDLVVTYVD